MPGGPLVGFLFIPMLLLAGIYFLDGRGWRFCCTAGLIVWCVLAVVLAVIQRDWIRLFVPLPVILFWIFMAEIKRQFKD